MLELKLKKAGHDYYESLAFTPFSCETMRESIVPDSCADIARIVETTGLVCLTGREISGDGRFCASGTVEVSVLYIPEKGEGPCALHFQIPFQCFGESQGDDPCEYLDIRGELRSIDTRMLNPRKVLSRADLVLWPEGCRHCELTVCTQAEDGDGTVELLRVHKETRVIAAIREKEFTYVEELPLAPGRGGAEEIISTRLELRGTDSKLVGSKLVVKGIAAASVLYRESGGRLVLLQQDLPFSQILEGEGLEETWESEAVYRLLGAACRIGGEGGDDDAHVMTLTMQLRARVTVWRTEEIDFIADLYSTAAPVACQTGELSLREDSRRQDLRLSGRELFETGTAVKAVLDTEVRCGGVKAGGSGDSLELPLWGRCLYLDENDTLHSVNKAFSLSVSVERTAEAQVQARAVCCGDVIASILPDGVELRFPVDLTMDVCRPARHVCVCGGEILEKPADAPDAPSLVLRKLGAGETLWSVAKQYRTTCRAILAVNELGDGEQVPLDRMLLIPKAR